MIATGSAGCNPYATTYQVQGNTLTISSLSITGQLCTEPPGIMEQETAYLAALPKAPSRYHPVRQKSTAIARRNFVLREMNQNGYLPAEDYAAAREIVSQELGHFRGDVVEVYLR